MVAPGLLALVLNGLALVYPSSFYHHQGRMVALVTLTGALALGGMALGMGIYLKRVRRVARLGGRVCFRCGFNLTGLEGKGRCPECGDDYDIQNPRCPGSR